VNISSMTMLPRREQDGGLGFAPHFSTTLR
jgi:hypothetical protein